MAAQSSGDPDENCNISSSSAMETSNKTEMQAASDEFQKLLCSADAEPAYEERIAKFIEAWKKFVEMYQSIENATKVCIQLYRKTLLVILDMNWDSLKSTVQTFFVVTIKQCRNLLQSFSDDRLVTLCESIINLCTETGPWANRLLGKILTSSAPLDDEMVKKYLDSENTEIAKARVQILLESDRPQLALRLCNVRVRSIDLEDDMFFVDTQLILLQNSGHVIEIAKTVQNWTCHKGVGIIRHMLESGIKCSVSDKVSLAECLCNIFLINDVLNPADNCCTKQLMQLWCMIHSYVGTEIPVLISNVTKIFNRVEHATSSAHFYLFVEQLYNEFGKDLRPLYIDLYVRGLTVDMNLLEGAVSKDNFKEETEIKCHLAGIFTKLVDLVKESDLLARECLLTAFSLEPTDDRLDKIEVIALRQQDRKFMKENGKMLEKIQVPTDCLCGRENECSSPLIEEKVVGVPQSDEAFAPWHNNSKAGCLVPSELLLVDLDGMTQQNLQDLTLVLESARSWQLRWTNVWSEMKQRCIHYREKVSQQRRITQVPTYSEQQIMLINTAQPKEKKNVSTNAAFISDDDSDLDVASEESTSESDFEGNRVKVKLAKKLPKSLTVKAASLRLRDLRVSTNNVRSATDWGRNVDGSDSVDRQQSQCSSSSSSSSRSNSPSFNKNARRSNKSSTNAKKKTDAKVSSSQMRKNVATQSNAKSFVSNTFKSVPKVSTVKLPVRGSSSSPAERQNFLSYPTKSNYCKEPLVKFNPPAHNKLGSLTPYLQFLSQWEEKRHGFKPDEFGSDSASSPPNESSKSKCSESSVGNVSGFANNTRIHITDPSKALSTIVKTVKLPNKLCDAKNLKAVADGTPMDSTGAASPVNDVREERFTKRNTCYSSPGMPVRMANKPIIVNKVLVKNQRFQTAPVKPNSQSAVQVQPSPSKDTKSFPYLPIKSQMIPQSNSSLVNVAVRKDDSATSQPLLPQPILNANNPGQTSVRLVTSQRLFQPRSNDGGAVLQNASQIPVVRPVVLPKTAAKFFVCKNRSEPPAKLVQKPSNASVGDQPLVAATDRNLLPVSNKKVMAVLDKEGRLVLLNSRKVQESSGTSSMSSSPTTQTSVSSQTTQTPVSSQTTSGSITSAPAKSVGSDSDEGLASNLHAFVARHIEEQQRKLAGESNIFEVLNSRKPSNRRRHEKRSAKKSATNSIATCSSSVTDKQNNVASPELNDVDCKASCVPSGGTNTSTGMQAKLTLTNNKIGCHPTLIAKNLIVSKVSLTPLIHATVKNALGGFKACDKGTETCSGDVTQEPFAGNKNSKSSVESSLEDSKPPAPTTHSQSSCSSTSTAFIPSNDSNQTVTLPSFKEMFTNRSRQNSFDKQGEDANAESCSVDEIKTVPVSIAGQSNPGEVSKHERSENVREQSGVKNRRNEVETRVANYRNVTQAVKSRTKQHRKKLPEVIVPPKRLQQQSNHVVVITTQQATARPLLSQQLMLSNGTTVLQPNLANVSYQAVASPQVINTCHQLQAAPSILISNPIIMPKSTVHVQTVQSIITPLCQPVIQTLVADPINIGPSNALIGANPVVTCQQPAIIANRNNLYIDCSKLNNVTVNAVPTRSAVAPLNAIPVNHTAIVESAVIIANNETALVRNNVATIPSQIPATVRVVDPSPNIASIENITSVVNEVFVGASETDKVARTNSNHAFFSVEPIGDVAAPTQKSQAVGLPSFEFGGNGSPNVRGEVNFSDPSYLATPIVTDSSKSAAANSDTSRSVSMAFADSTPFDSFGQSSKRTSNNQAEHSVSVVGSATTSSSPVTSFSHPELVSTFDSAQTSPEFVKTDVAYTRGAEAPMEVESSEVNGLNFVEAGETVHVTVSLASSTSLVNTSCFIDNLSVISGSCAEVGFGSPTRRPVLSTSEVINNSMPTNEVPSSPAQLPTTARSMEETELSMASSSDAIPTTGISTVQIDLSSPETMASKQNEPPLEMRHAPFPDREPPLETATTDSSVGCAVESQKNVKAPIADIRESDASVEICDMFIRSNSSADDVPPTFAPIGRDPKPVYGETVKSSSSVGQNRKESFEFSKTETMANVADSPSVVTSGGDKQIPRSVATDGEKRTSGTSPLDSEKVVANDNQVDTDGDFPEVFDASVSDVAVDNVVEELLRSVCSAKDELTSSRVSDDVYSDKAKVQSTAGSSVVIDGSESMLRKLLNGGDDFQTHLSNKTDLFKSDWSQSSLDVQLSRASPVSLESALASVSEDGVNAMSNLQEIDDAIRALAGTPDSDIPSSSDIDNKCADFLDAAVMQQRKSTDDPSEACTKSSPNNVAEEEISSSDVATKEVKSKSSAPIHRSVVKLVQENNSRSSTPLSQCSSDCPVYEIMSSSSSDNKSDSHVENNWKSNNENKVNESGEKDSNSPQVYEILSSESSDSRPELFQESKDGTKKTDWCDYHDSDSPATSQVYDILTSDSSNSKDASEASDQITNNDVCGEVNDVKLEAVETEPVQKVNSIGDRDDVDKRNSRDKESPGCNDSSETSVEKDVEINSEQGKADETTQPKSDKTPLKKPCRWVGFRQQYIDMKYQKKASGKVNAFIKRKEEERLKVAQGNQPIIDLNAVLMLTDGGNRSFRIISSKLPLIKKLNGKLTPIEEAKLKSISEKSNDVRSKNSLKIRVKSCSLDNLCNLVNKKTPALPANMNDVIDDDTCGELKMLVEEIERSGKQASETTVSNNEPCENTDPGLCADDKGDAKIGEGESSPNERCRRKSSEKQFIVGTRKGLRSNSVGDELLSIKNYNVVKVSKKIEEKEIEQPVKRKRGRPRKLTNSVETSKDIVADDGSVKPETVTKDKSRKRHHIETSDKNITADDNNVKPETESKKQRCVKKQTDETYVSSESNVCNENRILTRQMSKISTAVVGSAAPTRKRARSATNKNDGNQCKKLRTSSSKENSGDVVKDVANENVTLRRSSRPRKIKKFDL